MAPPLKLTQDQIDLVYDRLASYGIDPSEEFLPTELVNGILEDLVAQAEREMGQALTVDQRNQVYGFFVQRLFADEMSQKVLDLSAGLKIEKDEVIDWLDSIGKRQESILLAFPKEPLHSQRFQAVIDEGIENEIIPPNIFDPVPANRPQDAVEFLQAIEEDYYPAFIERAIQGDRRGDSIRTVFNDLEVDSLPQGRTFTSFENFQQQQQPDTAFENLVATVGDIVGTKGSNFKRAFDTVLSSLEITSADLEKDIVDADIAAAQLQFDSIMSSTRDLENAVGTAVLTMLDQGRSITRRSARVELQNDIKEFLKPFSTLPGAKSIAKDFLDRANIFVPDAVKQGIIDSLARGLLNYAETFPVAGGNLPQDPNEILGRRLPEIQEAVAGRTPTVGEFGQERIDQENAEAIVASFLESQGITDIPVRLQSIVQKMANDLRKTITDLTPGEQAVFSTDQYLQGQLEITNLRQLVVSPPAVAEFGQAQLDQENAEAIVASFLESKGITDIPEEFLPAVQAIANNLRSTIENLSLEEETTFSTDEFLNSAIADSNLKQNIDIARIQATAQKTADEFNVNDLNSFLFYHDINVTEEDKFRLLQRIPQLGIGGIQAELLQNRQTFETRFDKEQIAKSPVAGVRRQLLRQGIIREDSDPEFLRNIEDLIVQIANNLQDQLALDPDIDPAAFVDKQIASADPEKISEQRFLARRSQQTDVPYGLVPTITGGLAAETRPVTVDPTALRPAILEQLGADASPGFLNFLFRNEPELLAEFQQTQQPSIDQALFDKRLKMFSQPLKPAMQVQPGRDPLMESESRVRARLNLTPSEARHLALTGSRVTPPTAGAFLGSRIPGLRQEFRESPGGIAEARSEEQRITREAETARLREEQEVAQSQSRALRRGGRTVFSRIRG
jgi:hypothetical protein